MSNWLKLAVGQCSILLFLSTGAPAEDTSGRLHDEVSSATDAALAAGRTRILFDSAAAESELRQAAGFASLTAECQEAVLNTINVTSASFMKQEESSKGRLPVFSCDLSPLSGWDQGFVRNLGACLAKRGSRNHLVPCGQELVAFREGLMSTFLQTDPKKSSPPVLFAAGLRIVFHDSAATQVSKPDVEKAILASTELSDRYPTNGKLAELALMNWVVVDRSTLDDAVIRRPEFYEILTRVRDRAGEEFRSAFQELDTMYHVRMEGLSRWEGALSSPEFQKKTHKNARIWYVVGCCEWERGNPSLARQYIEKAARMTPDDSRIKETLPKLSKFKKGKRICSTEVNWNLLEDLSSGD